MMPFFGPPPVRDVNDRMDVLAFLCSVGAATEEERAELRDMVRPKACDYLQRERTRTEEHLAERARAYRKDGQLDAANVFEIQLDYVRQGVKLEDRQHMYKGYGVRLYIWPEP